MCLAHKAKLIAKIKRVYVMQKTTFASRFVHSYKTVPIVECIGYESARYL